MLLFLISRLPLLHLYPHWRRQYGLQPFPGHEQRTPQIVQHVNPQRGEGGGWGGLGLRLLQPSVLVTHSTTRSIANTKLSFFIFDNWLTSVKRLKQCVNWLGKKLENLVLFIPLGENI